LSGIKKFSAFAIGKTAKAVKNASPALAGAGKAVDDIIGVISIIAIILAKMSRKICPSVIRALKSIYYPVIPGIIFIKFVVKDDMEFIIQAPKIPIMVSIATILGTKVSV